MDNTTQAPSVSSGAPVGNIGIGDIVGGIASTGVNALAQFGMAEWQRIKQRELWREEKEYNTPKAQMERLRDAGLNPYLIYGDSNVHGNVSTAPSVRGAEVNIDPLGKIAQIAQVRNLNEELAKIHQETATSRVIAEHQQAMADKTKTETELQRIINRIKAKDAEIIAKRQKNGITSTDNPVLQTTGSVLDTPNTFGGAVSVLMSAIAAAALGKLKGIPGLGGVLKKLPDLGKKLPKTILKGGKQYGN